MEESVSSKSDDDDDFAYGSKAKGKRRRRQRVEVDNDYENDAARWQKWTEDEKRVYLEQVKIHGPKFNEISQAIPNKSLAQCRNFWMNNHIKLQLKDLAPYVTPRSEKVTEPGKRPKRNR